MIHPGIENQLNEAAIALDGATSESITPLCQQYLALLEQYRRELVKTAGTPEIRLPPPGSLPAAEVMRKRKELRSAIEVNTRERNRIEALLHSFTAVSGYAAVGVFNSLKYGGYDDWVLKAGGVARFVDGVGKERMTVAEAVAIAGLLRREEYVCSPGASL